ncbi:MAG: type I DNA topoisomerase [Bacillota bacterium]|nr:type I DNA topoisomerase [Bacillota bacterium]
MAKLVIVESPAKAKTIAKYLGSGYQVKASMGHLRDLPKKKLGVDIEGGFIPQYTPIEDKDKIIKELKEAADNSEFVYLATDPDREGEAISWHLKELLNLDDKNTKRITFNEITAKGVKSGIEAPRAIDDKLVDSQQTRRVLDRIVGYKLSPFLWRKIRPGLSAGRVQSVVTRLIVDREREIRDFKPKEYWTIKAELSASGSTFPASFHGDLKGKIELKDKEAADRILAAVTGSAFTVGTIKEQEKKRSPAPPFITSTLQQEASRKLNMASKRTMAVAQELYEGVELKEQGLTGLITYMRTDSTRLSDESLTAAHEYIKERFGEKFAPAKSRVYKTKSGAQDAHEAIRPTDPALTPDSVKKSLTPDQFKLYKLIWSRFVACQMADAIYDTVSADIISAGYVFKANGRTLKFAGFTAVYEESRDEDKNEEDGALPRMSEGMELKAGKIEPEQHFTQPPARYTEASLIHEMEEKGIGRPSTYAPIISTVLGREYVKKEQKSLKPTALGEAVTDLMCDKFNDIVDVKFTAKMEDELDSIVAGKTDYKKMLGEFYENFSGELSQAEKDLEKKRIKVVEESDVLCDLCGRKMVIKQGPFGKFLACPGYPECKSTKPITEDTGVSCPLCGARVVKKKSKSGYSYYGCEKNPTCKFMTWDKPTTKTCPNCGKAVFKRYTKEEKKNVCLNPECGWEEELKKKK